MKIAIEIPGARIMQLFASAIEGGDPVTTAAKGGWCNGINLKAASFPVGAGPKDDKSPWWDDAAFFVDGTELTIEIIEVDDESTGHETTHTITNADMVRGLSAMVKEYPAQFGQIIGDDIDGPCADLFLQCILFGEEKYA